MANFKTFICQLLLLCFLAPATARELTFEEQHEANQLEKQIEDLERRYDIYNKKFQAAKKRTDDLDTRVNYVPQMVQGRLTSRSGVPVTPGDSINNTTIYFTPYKGNYITVYYRNQWRIMRFSEISLALSGTTAGNIYDIFVYRASLGVLTLELSTAWTNSKVRSQALTLQDGVYVKASDTTRRYLGTFRTNGSANQYDDGTVTRGLWNYYNRVKRVMRVYDSSNTWNYNGNAWRRAGADANNDADFVIGINEVLCMMRIKTNLTSAGGADRLFTVGVGVNTLTVNSAQLMGASGDAGNVNPVTMALYYGYPGIGYNVLTYIESAPGGNVTSWGDNGAPLQTRSGYMAVIEG